MLLASSPLLAQENPETSKTAGGTLDEIIVTAQRREENLQSVPISVAAITADSLRAQGVTDIASLNGKVPSLNVSMNGPQNVFFVRGVGSPVAAPNGEQSVALYIDGVYMYAPVGNMFPVGADIDHIEVLKGPQGTLFGRNATAGVIQIVTKDPSQKAGGQLGLGYGNYDTFTSDFYATKGVAENLAANVSGSVKYMGDGYGENTFRGEDAYRTSHLKWQPVLSTSRGQVRCHTRHVVN
jgi:iron complex outermembrane recepter protein